MNGPDQTVTPEGAVTKSEYVESSHKLQERIGQAIAERPLTLSFLARTIGRKAPSNTGILGNEKDFFQVVAASKSADGQIQSATITTKWERGGQNKAPDAQIEFTDKGAIITAQEQETDFYGLTTERKIRVSPTETRGETTYSNIVDAWNGWNRSVAKSWHAQPDIIPNELEGQLNKDSIEVRVTYGENGELTSAALSSPNLLPIDLMGKFPPRKEIEKAIKKGKTPAEFDMAAALGGKKLQNEGGDYFVIDMDGLSVEVYPGVLVDSSELPESMKLPEGVDYQYTLRFRPRSKGRPNEYAERQYLTILPTLGIYPKFHPSSAETVKRGFVERGQPIDEKHFILFNQGDTTRADVDKFSLVGK